MSFYFFTKSFFNGLFKLLYRHKVYGIEHLIPGAAIIAPNHASFWDPPLIAASAPEEMTFLARASLFTPFMSFFLSRLHVLPAKGAESLESLKLINSLLKEEKKVVIFPEGKRTDDGHLGSFKTGIAMLALRANCPIIPVYIYGTYSIWERSRRFPRFFGRTACVFGSPISPAPYLSLPKKEAQESLAQTVRRSIEALETWYATGDLKSSPP